MCEKTHSPGLANRSEVKREMSLHLVGTTALFDEVTSGYILVHTLVPVNPIC